jgi:hypothetical protein
MSRVMGVALWALIAVPGLVRAEPPVQVEHKWCVRSDGGVGTYSTCEGPPTCSGTFESIGAAVAAARAAPDPDPSDPAAHMVCVDSPGIHTESVTVDNSDGLLGAYVGIQFTSVAGVNWCDDGDVARNAGFQLSGSGDPDALVEVLKLRTDAVECARSRPVFEASDIDFSATRLVALGGTAPVLVSFSATPQEHSVGVSRGIIEGVTGTVLDAGSTLFLTGSVLSGNESMGAALVRMSASSSLGGSNTTALELGGSVIVGNAVTGAPLVSSIEGLRVRQSVLWGNAIAGAHLVSVGPATPAFRAASHVMETEFSANTLLESGAAVTPAGPVHSPNDPEGGFTLPCGIPALQGVAVSSRQTASGVGQPGGYSLLGFTSPGSADTTLRMYRNYIVENTIAAAGALIDAGDGHQGTSLFMVHNLFGDHSVPVVRGGDGVGQCRLASVKNIYLGVPELALGSCWDRIEATADQVATDALDWEFQFPTHTISVVGPTWSGLPASPFEPTPDSLDWCEQRRAHCPNIAPGCLNDLGWCPSGDARNYLLTASARADLVQPFPWSNTMLDASGSASFGTPGPAGWDCAGDQPFPTDNFETKDADGFTDLVDCDNFDGAVVPTLPEFHGVGMPWCEAVPGSCYVCPPESCWPPGAGDCPELPPGDDDDSVTDDDDSTGDDDDDVADDDDTAAGDDDDDSDDQTVPVGCTGRGCGAALQPVSASVLLWLPLAAVRRRTRGDGMSDDSP